MNTLKRLTETYNRSKTLPLYSNSKYVIMSDCHRGSGNRGDNFLPNANLFTAALTYYYNRGFSYIELGDGDELWENQNMKQIVEVHNKAFRIMSKFYEDNRFYMIYGNHDMPKKDKKYLCEHCEKYYCEEIKEYCDLFPSLDVYEGLILYDDCNQDKIFLTHGHQGDFLNDAGWKIGRFLVRNLWRRLELLGINDPTRTAVNSNKKNKVERHLMEWSRQNNQMLIAGHTHRPSFPKVGEVMYFNDGSCVFPQSITAIEIENGSISLVKWSVMTRDDASLYVGKEFLEKPVCLRDYFDFSRRFKKNL